MALELVMDGAIQEQALRFFFAVQIQLPGSTINLIDGSGVVSFPVDGTATTFTGQDGQAGTISSIETITESIATSTPRLKVTLMPTDTGGIADIGAIGAQGSPVMIWFGLVDQSTGSVIGAPYLMWSAHLDVVTIQDTGSSRYIEVDTSSVCERLLVLSEGNRLTDAFHQRVFPGETGLLYNVASTVPMNWGTDVALTS